MRSNAAVWTTLFGFCSFWLVPMNDPLHCVSAAEPQTAVSEIFIRQALLGPSISNTTPVQPQVASRQTEQPTGATGLRLPTAEERQWDEDNMIKVEHVSPNALALARAMAGTNGVSARNAGSGLPTSVDNSLLSCFPPIRNQGGLNSCVAFAAIYYTMTHMVGLARGWDAKNGTDAQRFSPKWCYNMINNGNDGGSWFSTAYHLAINHGAATWSQFPYDSNFRAWSTDPEVWRQAIQYRMAQTGTIFQVDSDSSMNTVKQMLANGHVLNFATFIHSWQFKTVSNDPGTTADDAFAGQWVCHFVNGTSGSHAMTIVGYNDEIWTDINGNGVVDPGEKGAFKIANSWGNTWRNAGYAWIAYDALKTTSAVSGWTASGRQDGFTYRQAYWLSARASYMPRLLAEFTIAGPMRGDIGMTLGTGTTSATSPSTTWSPWAINFQGGAYAFDGTTTAHDGTFVFDFTDLAPTVGTARRYFLGLQTTSTTGTIKSFELVDQANGNRIAATGLPKSATNAQTYAWVNYTLPATNTAPTIGSIANQTIQANTATADLPFTIGDAETSASSLTLSASSSNTVLVPLSGIALGGSGTARTVKVTPSANNSGSTTITVTVSDGALSATSSFSVTVTPLNQAPQIVTGPSAMPNAPVVGTAVAFNVQASDPEGETLVYVWNFGNGAGANVKNPTYTYTTAGNYTVTVTATDPGGKFVSASLQLSVTPANTSPVIGTIANRTIHRNGSTGPLGFSVNDAETTANALSLSATSSNLSLVPLASIVLGGSGTQRTVTVTPAANKIGESTITVQVSDGSLSTSTSFKLTVIRQSPRFLSTPTASPNPGVVGEKVYFGVAAEGDEDTTISYQWSFGDGSQTSLEQPEHVFAQAGTYTISLKVLDSTGAFVEASLNLAVLMPADEPTTPDTPDQPKDPNTPKEPEDPITPEQPDAPTLQVDSLRIARNLRTAQKDSAQIKGKLLGLPATFIPNQTALALEIGGIMANFTLDSKGRARLSTGSVSLKMNAGKALRLKTLSSDSIDLPFKLALKQGNWSDNWQQLGLDTATDAKLENVQLPVSILLNQQRHRTEVGGFYTCKAYRSAAFKK